MAKLTTYPFARGATIKLGMYPEDVDPSVVTGITAHLRRLPDDGRTEIEPGTPIAATFLWTSRLAEGDIPAGWTFTISASVSKTLAVGAYLTDVQLVVGSAVVTTHAVRIEIYEPATVA